MAAMAWTSSLNCAAAGVCGCWITIGSRRATGRDLHLKTSEAKQRVQVCTVGRLVIDDPDPRCHGAVTTAIGLVFPLWACLRSAGRGTPGLEIGRASCR